MPAVPVSAGRSRVLWSAGALAAGTLSLLPVLAVLGGVLRPNGEMWRHQWNTRLPGEIASSLLLVAGVGCFTAVVGVGLAWLVGMHEFPGRRVFSWALVLPLALPAYILGFVVTSVLGVAGPVQGWWRSSVGSAAWFPEIRSMPVAIVTLGLTLYPYVYLLVRAALRDSAAASFTVARTLGAPPGEAFRKVVLPLLRPAIAAGVSVVTMETLTDFATVQYFGVDTVTVGVFRIWRGTYDRDAAAEVACLVLAFAFAIVVGERALRGRARFSDGSGTAGRKVRTRLSRRAGAAATCMCGAVVAVAFAAPVARLTGWVIAEQSGRRGTPLVDRFREFLSNSLLLMSVTVALCVAVAVIVANSARFAPSRLVAVGRRAATLGYAVPGPVVAMGVVVVVVGVDRLLGALGGDLPGTVATGSLVVLGGAYAIRFLAPAVSSVDAGLEQVPEVVTDSARSLGLRPSTVLARIHLPLSRASLFAAAVLVAVDAVKELPIALLLRPIGFDTLPVWVYNLASESRFQQAALPALAIVAVSLAPVALLSRRVGGE